MSIFEAIIQGILQGATEFLPISSSGHLSLSQHIMGVELGSQLFDVLLHLGTLIAVVLVYYKLILRLFVELGKTCQDIVHKKFKWSEMNQDRRLLFMLMIGLVPLFLLFAPIPGTGMKLKDLSDLLATDSNILAEGFALLATSAVLFLGIRANKKTQAKLVLRQKTNPGVHAEGRKKIHTVDAICMGLAQCVAAVFPGLSRSGSTISAGMMRGLNKQTALDYSFILGIPAILAATVLSIGDAFVDPVEIGAGALIAGVVTAAIVGFAAIKVLKWIVSSDKLHIFAIYALILGLVTIIIAIIEATMGINIFTGIKL